MTRSTRGTSSCAKSRAPDGSLQSDPKPPLDRHQFGGALGGAFVLPGLYDGHNRTFFFTDYAGLKESRGPGLRQHGSNRADTHRGDFSDFRDTSGNLIPIYDPLTTRLNPAFNSSLPVSASNPQFLRDQFPGNQIPSEPAQCRRPERRQHLPASERFRQLRQLHVDGEPGRHRQRVLRTHRSSPLGQGFLLRTLQLGQVQARRPSGPGRLLPADAGGGRRPVRSRSLRCRHSEHAADDAWRGLQLLEGRVADARQRASDGLREDGAVDVSVGLRHPRRRFSRHSRHQRHRLHDRACRTSTSRT